jgi:hypothetical protein
MNNKYNVGDMTRDEFVETYITGSLKNIINGPLKEYLSGNISYGEMFDLINKECGTSVKTSMPSPYLNFKDTPIDFKMRKNDEI